MVHKISFVFFLFSSFVTFSACSEKQAPQSTASIPIKSKVVFNQKTKEGNYYIDKMTGAQVFVPIGFTLDLKSEWPNWGKNFLIKHKQDDFRIFVRFDEVKDENDEAQICKQTLLESPIPNLDSSKLKVYPFLKGEFNADTIVTTDKIYTIRNEDPASKPKANLFQIRKKNVGCYTFLFIYGNEASLNSYNTEKEIFEYVKFQQAKPESEPQAQAQ